MTRGRAPLVAALVAAAAISAGAQPTVIRDARLDAIRNVVSVGRGYGLSTNTVFASCLASDRDTGDTSYDLDFSLLSLQSQEDLDQLDRDGQRFVQGHLARLAREQRPYHALVATMTVKAHVRALDESQQKLTDEVTGLLDQGRLSAFVSVCGTHYVRTVKRRSALYVLFTYEAPATDHAFEQNFQAAISGFDLDAAESDAERASDAAITADAARRDLRIVAWAIGLQAQPSGVIAFDMATYRTMVNEAFKAAQHDRAGIPDEIEIVPWVSHPTIVAALLRTSSRTDLDLYAMRQLIGEAAERYLELTELVSTVKSEAVTAARCGAMLEATFVDGGQLRPSYAGAYVKSHRAGSARLLPLTELMRALAPAKLATLQDEAARFALDLDENQQPRAPIGRCLAQLEREELRIRYQTLPECVEVGLPFTPDALATLAVVDEFCFPDLAAPLPPTRAGG